MIIIKKGRTEAGKKGTSSHTGALAGDDQVWDSALRQAGAIRVEDVDEMVDLLTTFLFLPTLRGKKVVVIGAGGGASVRAAEECEIAGLRLPTVPDDLRRELNRYFSLAGSMLRNPVDILAEPLGDGAWVPVLKALDGWEEADMLLWQISPDMEPIRTEEFRRAVLELRRGMIRGFSQVKKPKAMVIHTLETLSGLEEMVALREACNEQGIAFYPSVYRAALAVSRFVDYQERKRRPG